MSYEVPVSASSDDPAHPPGALIAEFFWVTPAGQIAKELGSAPVQNGVAVFDGPPPAPGLFWAIRIQQTATPGALFRSGPLRRLPGPPSPALTGRVSFLVSRGSFSLTDPGSEGVPEVVTDSLQNLPAPLEFAGVQLSADSSGNYVVTLRGRIRFVFVQLPFVYQRAFRLVGNLDPARPALPVLAEPAGTAAIAGRYVLPYAAVLDRLMQDAVQRQLATAATTIAGIALEHAGASFQPQTVSVSALQLTQYSSPPAAYATMTFSGGAITSLVLPPMPGPLEPG